MSYTSLFETISSNCGKILLLTKHILHVVLQCLSSAVGWVQSSLWSIYASYEVFFPARVGKGLVFSFLFPYIDPVWFSSLLSVEWYDSSIPIDSALLADFIPSAEIITLVSRVAKFALSSQKDCLHIQMILWHPWYRKNSLDAGFRPWYLWEHDLDAKCLP